jgi:hypothetical protein
MIGRVVSLKLAQWKVRDTIRVWMEIAEGEEHRAIHVRKDAVRSMR